MKKNSYFAPTTGTLKLYGTIATKYQTVQQTKYLMLPSILTIQNNTLRSTVVAHNNTEYSRQSRIVKYTQSRSYTQHILAVFHCSLSLPLSRSFFLAFIRVRTHSHTLIRSSCCGEAVVGVALPIIYQSTLSYSVKWRERQKRHALAYVYDCICASPYAYVCACDLTVVR